MFEHSGFEGHTLEIVETTHLDLGLFFDDRASSVIVIEGCKLTLFKNHNNKAFINTDLWQMAQNTYFL